MTTRIEPTVGRVVLVHLSGNANALAGLVCAVHERGINVAVFDEHAVQHRACGIPLIQDGDAPPVSGSWAEWMPYQKAVASGALPATLHAAVAEAADALTAGNVGDPAAVNAGADAAAL